MAITAAVSELIPDAAECAERPTNPIDLAIPRSILGVGNFIASHAAPKVTKTGVRPPTAEVRSKNAVVNSITVFVKSELNVV